MLVVNMQNYSPKTNNAAGQAKHNQSASRRSIEIDYSEVDPQSPMHIHNAYNTQEFNSKKSLTCGKNKPDKFNFKQ